MSDAHEETFTRWTERPWLMAAIGAVAGLIIHWLSDSSWGGAATEQGWRVATAAGVSVAALSFLLTAERKRLNWAIAFSVGWGLVIGLIAWFTSSYNMRPSLFEFPFFSGLFAVILAAPLFQVVRDEGRRSLNYPALHRYAWTDAIIGGASLAFTGLTFLLAFLLSSLFAAIGITVLRTLLNEGWFDMMMAGAAFGAASAVLRERDALLGTLQRLVMVVFSVLAPVLAVALLLFLVALPLTGFAGLWKSGLPETPLLLSSAAFAILFLNAIIGDSPEDRSAGRLWRATALILVLIVLPLGLLAGVSMGMRVSQYGWTPTRIWGVISSLVAIGYGVSGWIAVARRRGEFDELLRGYQARMAVVLCGVALLLAMPLIDFGAISARSQMARLSSGRVTTAKFDWTAMAFDFGPAGRNRLAEFVRTGLPEQRPLAAAALKSQNRYSVQNETEAAADRAGIEQRIRVLAPGLLIDEALKQRIAVTGECGAGRQCALLRQDSATLILVGRRADGTVVHATLNLPSPNRVPATKGASAGPPPIVTVDDYATSTDVKVGDLRTTPIEVRPVTRRQLFVDGKPVGQPFE